MKDLKLHLEESSHLLKLRKRYMNVSYVINALLTTMIFFIVIDINHIRTGSPMNIDILIYIFMGLLVITFIWCNKKAKKHDGELNDLSKSFFLNKINNSPYLTPGRKQRYLDIYHNEKSRVRISEAMMEFLLEEANQAEYLKEQKGESTQKHSY